MNPFIPDRPCREPSDDRLGYAPLARRIAQSVLRGCPAEGLVVGLHGTWGQGKTTFLNFLEHEVANDGDDDPPPLVVRFNPWWFSGREDLVRRFFREFESAAVKRRASTAAISGAARKLGEALATLPLPWIAAAGKSLINIVKYSQNEDVAALKKSLDDALAREAFRVLVLIDDVDRLQPDEMLSVFQLAKAVGDLPNTIYVLAFDRTVCINALSSRFGPLSEQYLEKIIQVHFDLPPFRRATLHQMFEARFLPLLTHAPPELRDAERLNILYWNVLDRLLRTPRHVARLTNALAVTYPPVVQEVNAADLVALEALRLVSPEAHAFVHREASHFVGIDALFARVTDATSIRSCEQDYHESWLSQQGHKRAVVESLIRFLFPGVLSGAARFDVSSMRDARRICTEEHFDRYFAYTVEGEALPRRLFLQIISSSSLDYSVRAIRELCGGHTDSPPIIDFLVQLRDYLHVPGRQLATPAPLLFALCGAGDLVIAESYRTGGCDILFASAVTCVLRCLPPAERFSTLVDSLHAAGISTVVRVVTAVAADHGRLSQRGAQTEEPVFERDEDVDRLASFALQRIRDACSDNTLWSAPWLLRILLTWEELGEGETMRAWVVQRTAEDADLTRLVRMATGYASEAAEIRLGPVRALFDLPALTHRLQAMLERLDAPTADRQLARSLLEAIAAQ